MPFASTTKTFVFQSGHRARCIGERRHTLQISSQTARRPSREQSASPPLAQGYLVDAGELIVGELAVLERLEVVEDLLRAAGPDEHARDLGVAELPGERHLGKRLAAIDRKLVQRHDLAVYLGRKRAFLEVARVVAHARVGRDAPPGSGW